MKKNNIKIGVYSFLLLVFCSLSACNSFLDELPDNRAELKGPKDVKDLLVAAYTNLHPHLIFEKMSDNVMDVGVLYGNEEILNENMYLWEDTHQRDWDSPQEIWDGAYRAISNANQALEAIEKLGFSDAYIGAKTEALLCRAYHHFLLSTVFCMAYDEKTAHENLGLAYSLESEKEVGVQYERGTLEELYENINKDIEDALKNVSSLEHDVPLYHFNKAAAYAFAARFNLFYKKDPETLGKVIKYANEVLGDDAFSKLRNLKNYSKYTNPLEWTFGYINKSEVSNLLLITNRTLWGRKYRLRTNKTRFSHSRFIANNGTFWSRLPGLATDDEKRNFSVYKSVFGNDQNVYLPKLSEIFEYTDIIAQIGQPHVVVMAFTTDETLLCRAEANVLLKNYDAAAKDLSDWYRIKGAQKEANVEIIKEFYSNPDLEKTITKPLNPKFDIEEGLQTTMLQAVLHARRIEGVHEGTRFVDIKRYGIQVTHNRDNNTDIVLKPHDLRTAVQIPDDVVSAGMQKNPR